MLIEAEGLKLMNGLSFPLGLIAWPSQVNIKPLSHELRVSNALSPLILLNNLESLTNIKMFGCKSLFVDSIQKALEALLRTY